RSGGQSTRLPNSILGTDRGRCRNSLRDPCHGGCFGGGPVRLRGTAAFLLATQLRRGVAETRAHHSHGECTCETRSRWLVWSWVWLWRRAMAKRGGRSGSSSGG